MAHPHLLESYFKACVQTSVKIKFCFILLYLTQGLLEEEDSCHGMISEFLAFLAKFLLKGAQSNPFKNTVPE